MFHYDSIVQHVKIHMNKVHNRASTQKRELDCYIKTILSNSTMLMKAGIFRCSITMEEYFLTRDNFKMTF